MTQNSSVHQNRSLGKRSKIQLVSKGQIVLGDSTDLSSTLSWRRMVLEGSRTQPRSQDCAEPPPWTRVWPAVWAACGGGDAGLAGGSGAALRGC